MTGRKKKAEIDDAFSLMPYQVEMTASAEAVYVDMARKARAAEDAGDYANAHCTIFNMVKDAIKNIIPSDPLNKSHALRGDLSNVFRIRKGRLRICWIASSRIRKVCILFIAETFRKEGDASDPYVIFKRLLESGKFDEVIQKLGVRITPRS
jgi:mRNA-degrading endonuclease RelE of RelBE toxin-antitoxin system